MLRPVLAACLVLTATTASVGTPRFAPAPGVPLRKTFDGEHTLELEDMTVSMGGQQVPPEYLPEMEMLFDERQSLEVRDRFLSVADGRPTELLRTYEAIEVDAGQQVTVSGMSDESSAGSATSELVGKTVRFTWDPEAEAYERAFPDGDEDELLEGLDEDLDLRAFLPEAEVEVGDHWDVEGASLRWLLQPGGDLALEWDTPGDWERGGDVELSGDLEVRLAEVEDGVARLVIEGTLEGVLVEDTDLESVPVADGAATQTSTTIWEVEGELRWDLAAGHARDAELRARMHVHIEIEKLESEPGPAYAQTLDLAGDWRLRFALEPVE